MTTTPHDSASEALLKTADYIDRFGWDAPGLGDSLPSLSAHLNVAACSIAASTGEPPSDIEAVAAYRLTESLKNGPDWSGLTEWECDPSRAADDIAAALRNAADGSSTTLATT